MPSRTATDGMAVRPRRLAFVLWPAFLMAGLLEMLVFAVVDPSDLHFGVQPVELSREAVYSMAFLAFWLLVTVACLLTALLLVEPDDPGGPGRRRPWP